MRGGYLRFQAQYLRRVHVHRPESITPVQSRQLIEAFWRRDRHLATAVATEIYRVPPSLVP
ncbi:MAG: hypothetical protein ACLQGP_21370 [Isosphaeraceae bacterium]